MEPEETEVRRYPILLNEHAIALVTIFIKPHDRIDDLWSIDYLMDRIHGYNAGAELIRQITDGGRWSPKLLMDMRAAITEKLKEEDANRGGITNFAGEGERADT